MAGLETFCLARRLAAYGNTNMYRPVNMSSASGNSGEYVNKPGGFSCFPMPIATKLAMTVSVKAMDSQR